ncbi:MAG: peptide ABC transporter substrate-binding protein [Anaerolineae bacterium]
MKRLFFLRLNPGLVSSFIILVLIAAGLAGCSLGPPAPLTLRANSLPTPTPIPTPNSVEADDTLRIFNPQAPTTLNPHRTLSSKDFEPARITYEPLASFDRDGHLIPFLAAEIPTLDNGGIARDGMSVTWKLRQDVRWSDGQPFTADDVLFTYEYVTNPATAASTVSSYSNVSHVEVVDPYTVKVVFKTPTSAWAVPFVGTQGMILPRHVFQAYNGSSAANAPANTLPVGTGPYRVMEPGIKPQEVLLLGTQLMPTNKITFEANPYYRDKDKVPFRRVIYQGGGTAQQAARSVLQEGTVDYAYELGQLSPQDLEGLKSSTKGRLITNFGSRVERIMLNQTDPDELTDAGERSSMNFPHPIFSDLRVRQAFAHAINRDAIARLYGITGKATGDNLVSPPAFPADRRVAYEYDLDKAKALLDEAGWIDTDGSGIREKDGERLRVVFAGKPSGIVQATQQIIQKDLAAIGVDVTTKIVDSAVLFGAGAANPDSMYRFNADMIEAAYRNPSPDPSNYMGQWTCDQIPQKHNNWAAGVNVERWCRPEYDVLLQAAKTEQDPEKSRQMYTQLEDMQLDDVVMIPIVYQADVLGANLALSGVNLTPWDAATWNIKDWRRSAP